jgi:hypothetical protein
MFTVEIESDAAIVRTLDQDDMHEDVEVIFAEDGDVYMRQFEPEMNAYQMLIMSSQQWMDLMAAYKSGEGSYFLEVRHE